MQRERATEPAPPWRKRMPTYNGSRRGRVTALQFRTRLGGAPTAAGAARGSWLKESSDSG